MPVTVNLSKRFYEVFGEELAKELVDWFNAVDATYRADLRELNELNFARFDSKLEQRLAGLRSETEAGFARADAKLEQRTMELRSEMRTGLAQASTELHEVRADILKWMFGFWAPTALAVVGTGLGVLNLLLRR